MLKQIVRGLVPPIILSWMQGVRRRFIPGASIYNGLYSDVAHLPEIYGSPFSHENWISYVSERAASRKGGVAYQDMHEMCLSLLASTLSTDVGAREQVIIDFGGGVGMYWPTLKAQNKSHRPMRYVVVDGEENCVRGRHIFSDEPIDFYSDLDLAMRNHPHPAIVNVASTLQYCLDYGGMIAKLCASLPTFIVISRHPAPKNGLPVAYSIQSVTSPKGFCGQIPVVLLSVATVVDLMQAHDYLLVADYYSALDSGKYWQNKTADVFPDFLEIIDHALVFQHQASMAKASFNTGEISPSA
jgi:putative methyltransferase (TIGR04325 family)